MVSKADVSDAAETPAPMSLTPSRRMTQRTPLPPSTSRLKRFKAVGPKPPVVIALPPIPWFKIATLVVAPPGRWDETVHLELTERHRQWPEGDLGGIHGELALLDHVPAEASISQAWNKFRTDSMRRLASAILSSGPTV